AMLQSAMLYVRAHGPLEVAASAAPKQSDRPLSPQELAARVLQLSHKWRDRNTLELRLRILQGFHINAHDASPGLIPTELSGADHVDYPEGELMRAEFAEQPIKVYHGQVNILAHFKSPADPVKLSLRYQACDETSCLPP